MDLSKYSSCVFVISVLTLVLRRLAKGLARTRACSVISAFWPIVSVVPWLFQGEISELNLSLLVLSWESLTIPGAMARVRPEQLGEIRHQAEFLHELLTFM